MKILLPLLLLLATSFSHAVVTIEDLYNATNTEVSPAVITLNWSAPTTRENGDTLGEGELGGYEIYIIPPEGMEPQTVVINDPLVTSHELPLSVAGEYYLSIAAFDSSRIKSVPSETVQTLVAGRSKPNAPGGITIRVTCGPESTCNFYIVR